MVKLSSLSGTKKSEALDITEEGRGEDPLIGILPSFAIGN